MPVNHGVISPEDPFRDCISLENPGIDSRGAPGPLPV